MVMLQIIGFLSSSECIISSNPKLPLTVRNKLDHLIISVDLAYILAAASPAKQNAAATDIGAQMDK